MTDNIVSARRHAGAEHAKNCQDRPLTPDEKVDQGSEDSMDASDPAAVTAPGDHGNPVPSSGFPETQD